MAKSHAKQLEKGFTYKVLKEEWLFHGQNMFGSWINLFLLKREEFFKDMDLCGAILMMFYNNLKKFVDLFCILMNLKLLCLCIGCTLNFGCHYSSKKSMTYMWVNMAYIFQQIPICLLQYWVILFRWHWETCSYASCFMINCSVVQMVDGTVHWINHHPLEQPRFELE